MATDDKDTKAKAKKPAPTPTPPTKGQDPMLALRKARSIGAGKPADVADPVLQHLQWQQGRPQSAVGQPGDPMAALSKATGFSVAPPAEFEWARTALDTGVQGLLGYLGLGDSQNRSNMLGQLVGAAMPFVSTGGRLLSAGESSGSGAAGPIARFLGWQKGIPEEGIPHMPMYNVEAPGHPLDRSTVTPATLASHGIPFTPPPPHGFDASAPLVTGQGEQVSPGFFNKPVPTAPTPPPADPMAQLVSRFGGKGPSDPRPR